MPCGNHRVREADVQRQQNFSGNKLRFPLPRLLRWKLITETTQQAYEPLM
jgi:hypothetical protein